MADLKRATERHRLNILYSACRDRLEDGLGAIKYLLSLQIMEQLSFKWLVQVQKEFGRERRESSLLGG